MGSQDHSSSSSSSDGRSISTSRLPSNSTSVSSSSSSTNTPTLHSLPNDIGYASSIPPNASFGPTGPSESTSGITSSSSTDLPSSTTSLSPALTHSSPTTTVTPAPSAKPNTLAATSSSHAGAIAGGVIGGIVFLVLVALGTVLYFRARKRKRTAPSSEFINSIRTGTTPVLRLDSGAEYSPALGEKSAGYSAYPPSVPIPCSQDSYYTAPLTKFPDEMIPDPPSGRPSYEKPLQPQRYSSQRRASDAFVAQHQSSASVGSRRELWGGDIEVVPEESDIMLLPVRHSPLAHTGSVLQFAPRFSLLDDASPQYSPPPHSPLSLSPLRRQPDPEDT